MDRQAAVEDKSVSDATRDIYQLTTNHALIHSGDGYNYPDCWRCTGGYGFVVYAAPELYHSNQSY